MENEIWKPINKPIDLTGRFEISSEGNLKRVGYFTKHKKIWKPDLILKISKAGKYMKIGIKHGGKIYNLSIHRLVCYAFHPNPKNKPQTNHINGIKHDNRAVNLEWCDQSENIRHAQSIGLMKFAKPKIKVYKRKEDKKHKPPKKVINIETGEIYGSLEIVCKLNGFNIKNIRRQINGDRYCYTQYRYVGEESKAKLPVTKIVKEKTPKVVKIAKPKPARKPVVRKPMIMFDLYGNIVQNFPSMWSVAKHFNTTSSNFNKQFKESKRGYYKGYIFKYA